MPYEVVNTSVARGLTSGHSGFCDVLRTRGLPEEINSLLAPLNFYNEKLAKGKPTCGVRSIRFGGQFWGIVSRVIPNGNDYTGRQNRLAHHLIAPPSELKTLCPATVLAGFSFRDGFTDTPRYLDREPEVSEITDTFEDVWKCMGGKEWREHISSVALSGSRVVVLIPSSANGRSVVISILLGIPADKRWDIGIVEASSADQCWVNNARIRVLTMDASDADDQRSWPGEVLVDLRHQSKPPSVALKVPIQKGEKKLDFSAFALVTDPLQTTDSEKPSQPIVVNIDFESNQDDEIVQCDAENGTERTSQSPLNVGHSEFLLKQTILWLIVGAFVGALVGFFIVNLK